MSELRQTARNDPDDRRSVSDSRGGADSERSAREHFSDYSIARYLSEFLFLLRGLLLARILGPALFGVWSQLKIALLFLQHSQLGVHEALLREVPYALGGGHEGRAREIESTSLGFSVLTSTVMATLIAAVVLIFLRGWAPELRRAWLMLPVLCLLAQLYWYAHVSLRSTRRFGQAGRIMVGFAFLSSAAGILAAVRYGLQGFLVAVAISYAAALLWAGGGSPPFLRPRLNRPVLRELLRVGFPIMMAGALLIVLWNIDKLAVWIFMSRESMGIYALGSYLVVSVMLVPEAVSVVLYPRLMERVARAKGVGELGDFLTRPSLVLSFFASPILGLLFLSFHLPIVWLLPRYTPTIMPGKILIAAIFFMALARMPHVLLVSLDRQRRLVALTVVAIVVGGAAVTGMILQGYGLVGVALGAASGYLVYSVLTMGAAIRALEMPGKKVVAFVASVLAPYLIVIFAVGVILQLLPESEAGLMVDILKTGLRCSLFAIAAGSALWILARRQGLFPLHQRT